MIALGIDTSNYTTSVALYDTVRQEIIQEKKLLPVKQGEKGLRQSDAVFHHTVQLPQEITKLFYRNTEKIACIGASAYPRRKEGSYMPCFLVGKGFAESFSAIENVPAYFFSHQEGHVIAALYSAKQLELLKKPFLAFHLSGGTTDALLVSPNQEHILDIDLVFSSLDLKAGQLIDRVGVMLGLQFPCGPAIEKLAFGHTKDYHIHPTVKNGNCCLSGVENQCQMLFREQETNENIAWFCLSSIIAAVDQMVKDLYKSYPDLPILFSGGVSSNRQMQTYFQNKYQNCFFAEPIFSADNAAGIAILTAMMKEKSL